METFVPDPTNRVITTITDPRLRAAGLWYAQQQNSIMNQSQRKSVLDLGDAVKSQVERLKVNIRFDGNQLLPPEMAVCPWCQRRTMLCRGCQPREKPQQFSTDQFFADWDRDRTLHFDPRIMEPRGNYDTKEMLTARLLLSIFHDAGLHCALRLGFSLSHELVIHQLTLTMVEARDENARLYLTNGVFLPVVASAFTEKRTPGLTKFVAERCPFLPDSFY